MNDQAPLSWHNVGDGYSRVDSNRTRIFVADDDDDMRILVCRALEKDGYDVVPIKDGLDAMNRIQEAFESPLLLPDLIIMDVLMPRYSGIGVLTALRRARWFTPVIMMTGFAHESVLQRAKDLGALTVFKKPFDMDDLRTAVLNASLTNVRARSGSLFD